MSRIILKLITLFLLSTHLILTAQIAKMEPDEEGGYYPLTATKVPKGSYKKDTNNELSAFEGTWKGHWEDKTVIIKFNKVVRGYKKEVDRYEDYLIATFQVTDNKGNILFDTINISNKNILFRGLRLFPNGKYSLGYTNNDLCGIGGFVHISFTDATKTKLKLFYMPHSILITGNCPYLELPEPFPVREDFILTKQ